MLTDFRIFCNRKEGFFGAAIVKNSCKYQLRKTFFLGEPYEGLRSVLYVAKAFIHL